MRIRYTVDVNIKYITIRDRTININKLLVEKFGDCYLETNQSRLNKRLHSFYANEWYITFFFKLMKKFNFTPPPPPPIPPPCKKQTIHIPKLLLLLGNAIWYKQRNIIQFLTAFKYVSAFSAFPSSSLWYCHTLSTKYAGI